MGLLSWFRVKPARTFPDPVENAEKSHAKRLDNANNQRMLQLEKQQLEHMEEMLARRQRRERLEDLQEQLYGTEEEPEEEDAPQGPIDSPEWLLYSIIARAMDKKNNAGQAAQRNGGLASSGPSVIQDIIARINPDIIAKFRTLGEEEQRSTLSRIINAPPDQIEAIRREVVL